MGGQGRRLLQQEVTVVLSASGHPWGPTRSTFSDVTGSPQGAGRTFLDQKILKGNKEPNQPRHAPASTPAPAPAPARAHAPAHAASIHSQKHRLPLPPSLLLVRGDLAELWVYSCFEASFMCHNINSFNKSTQFGDLEVRGLVQTSPRPDVRNFTTSEGLLTPSPRVSSRTVLQAPPISRLIPRAPAPPPSSPPD